MMSKIGLATKKDLEDVSNRLAEIEKRTSRDDVHI